MPDGQKKKLEWQKLNNIIGSNNTQAVDLKFFLEVLKNWLSYLPYNQRSPSQDTF